VLALGDSLTNGAVPSLNANHPYALRLGELLRAEFGGNRPVDIKTVGARP
jgi:lysophospholipase L1-like esterase